MHRKSASYLQNSQKGLKLQGEGKCFDRPSERDFSSFLYGKPSMTKSLEVHRYKFYLAFENAFHCTGKGFPDVKNAKNGLQSDIVF